MSGEGAVWVPPRGGVGRTPLVQKKKFRAKDFSFLKKKRPEIASCTLFLEKKSVKTNSKIHLPRRVPEKNFRVPGDPETPISDQFDDFFAIFWPFSATRTPPPPCPTASILWIVGHWLIIFSGSCKKIYLFSILCGTDRKFPSFLASCLPERWEMRRARILCILRT